MNISSGMKLGRLVLPLAAVSIAAFLGAQTLKPGVDPLPPAQPGQLGPAPEKAAAAKDLSDETIQTPVGVQSGDFRTTVRSVIVPTSVYDPSKKGFVNGLKQADFEVLDNDKPQRISAEVTELPVSVVMVVQANSDVEPLVPQLRNAGILLHGLVTGEEGDAAILTFDYRKTVIQDFTNNSGQLDDAMRKFHTGATTAALNDAVLYAAGMLKKHDPNNARRRVILLLSRNVDKGSETKLEQAIQEIQFDNVIIYCVDMSTLRTTFFKKPDDPRPANGGVPPEALPDVRGQIQTPTDVAQSQTGNLLNVIPPIARSAKDIFKRSPAEAFSYSTGGEIFSFGNMKSLEKAITAIGNDLNSQYILAYSPSPETRTEPGFHTIRVVVNRPGLNVRTRPGYWWGGGQQQ